MAMPKVIGRADPAMLEASLLLFPGDGGGAPTAPGVGM
jgi:hypothetical protein